MTETAPLADDYPLARHFQPSYAVSRRRFIDAARSLAPRHGLLIDSRALSEQGPDGETLALDFAVFGSRRPQHALVVSSGTHGVEGYTGSALQHHLLAEVLPQLRLAPGTALILQHANNPYGFAWHRRVNESNVDINRNFQDRFDTSVCDPDYDQLHDVLNPPDLLAPHEAERWARIDAFIATHGVRRFQQAAVGGQYRYPGGLQYGGAQLQAGPAHLLDLVREHLCEARTVIWLDIHTGLGGFGDCELVTGASADSTSYRFSNQVWQGDVKSAASGESVSTPLNGLLDRGVEAVLPSGCRFAFAYPEFGAYEPLRTIRALRADNWLHRHGDPRSTQALALRADMLEVFRPASAAWQHRVTATGALRVAQALDHLPGVGGTR
jgi:hypothetical protein